MADTPVRSSAMTTYKRSRPQALMVVFAAVAALSVAIPTETKADTYAYTGNDFTNLFNENGGDFTVNDNIAGSFTISGPLPADTTIFLTPSSYTFSSYGVTFTNLNSGIDVFSVTADAAGEIENWNIVIAEAPYLFVTTSVGPPSDETNDNSTGSYGYNVNDQGTWSDTTTSSIPEAPALPIFGCAFGILVLARRTICPQPWLSSDCI